MFGIGLPEMIVILAVALIVVGPDKLPELARSLAKGIGELKKTMNQVKENLSEETKTIESVQNDLKKSAGQLQKNLLNEQTQPWDSEKNSAVHGERDEQDIIDVEPLEERPWEKEAQADPLSNTDKDADTPEQQAPEVTTPAKDSTPPTSTV